MKSTTHISNITITAGLVSVAITLSSFFATGNNLVFAQPKEKVTICHATSSGNNPYEQIIVDKHAISGHFDNNGTHLAGHEQDLMYGGEVQCPGGLFVTYTPTPTPTCTPTPEATNTPTPTITITPTPEDESTPTPTATSTPAVTNTPTPTDSPKNESSNNSQTTQTGQVQSVTAFAETGTFTQGIIDFLFGTGMLLTTLGGAAYVRGKSK
jgi:hypothetical protein